MNVEHHSNVATAQDGLSSTQAFLRKGWDTVQAEAASPSRSDGAEVVISSTSRVFRQDPHPVPAPQASPISSTDRAPARTQWRTSDSVAAAQMQANNAIPPFM